mgnify:FL=1
MLERLSIKNIALIREQTINFKSGFNVLTGETGAGKSLIIDSLSLLLGEKADKSLISHGETFATVEAVFSSLSDNVLNLLEEFGLEREDTLIISRKISIDGKNECRVNGTTFTLSMLKKLSAPLMDLHGQFEHQNLLKVSNHIGILDSYGASKISGLLQNYQICYAKYEENQNELRKLVTNDKERERLIDLYSYQVEEIDNAGFYDGEEEELKDFRNQVLHSEKIMDSLSNAVTLGKGDGYEYAGVAESIKKMQTMLGMVAEYSKEIAPQLDRIESLKIEFEDVVDTLEEIKDNMYFDEQKAKQNEERLDLLSSFKKKYGSTISEIIEYRDKTQTELEKLINSENRVNELKKEQQKLEAELILTAEKLSKARKESALKMEKEVTSELVSLGMKSARFVIDIQPLSLENRNKDGFDRVEFMFSANLGEEVKPLKAVASGGEMSRFMLAVKNITAKIEGISTLIFDEIDTGVSGMMALVLGEKLCMVSKFAQVICVTHLAQVASFGKTQFLIEKSESQGKTITSVKELDRTERVKEIARLVSGVVSEKALQSAEELLKNAEDFEIANSI